MRSPSLDFALRAILRMSQFAPGELVLRAQEKVPKEKGTPVHSSAIADPFRSSPIRGRAQLAISLCSIRSDRVRACIPAVLRYSVRATGLGGSSQCRLKFDVHSPWRSRASQ